MKKIFIYLTGLIMTTTVYGQSGTSNGFSIANLDRTAIPGDDFYRYACGGWIDQHPMKPEYARFGTFDVLRENSQDQVKLLIEELSSKQHEKGSISQKVGDLYALAMDSVRLNAEGAAPLQQYLQSVQQLKNKSELSRQLSALFRDGIYPFFTLYVYADPKNSSLNILQAQQGGFSMGDRDYYFEQDDHTVSIREKYNELIRTLFGLTGYTGTEVDKAVESVLRIETQLAQAAYSRIDLRIPDKNYHKITVGELRQQIPALDWDVIFTTLGIQDVQELNLEQPEPLAEVNKILQESSLEDIKYYLAWNVIRMASAFLSDDFRNASFEFYGKTLSGQQEQRPRWKRAVDVVNGALGEAVGQVYVEKYFPPAAKERMMRLVGNLQTALGERIQNLEWMSEPTKEKALEKLGTFYVKIGYPDKWRDYSGLQVEKSLSYFENILHSNRFDHDYMFGKWNKPLDRDEWLMTPQTVNAYYNPSTNEICFPAAILQPPFFDMEADDAVNYGAIGVVIGHEMTHGFDDQGRHYDKNGNLSDWWTEEDAAKFTERAQVLVDFFDHIVVLDTVHANGQLTLGENIADHGGLQVAWQAYQHALNGKVPAPVDGFSAAQRFFLGYAALWAGNVRDAEILRLTKIDPHSLSKWRVDGALPHIDMWYDAFDVTAKNRMFVPKEKRASIW